jgi:hypothetical protein
MIDVAAHPPATAGGTDPVPDGYGRKLLHPCRFLTSQQSFHRKGLKLARVSGVGMLRSSRIVRRKNRVGFLPEINDTTAAESLATLKRNFGLAPGIYRAQMLRPDLVDAQVKLLDRLLFSKGALSRVQKEFILLAVFAENSNAYFPTLHLSDVAVLRC